MSAQLRQRGFTLIELMFVVATIGILAAVALPAYQDYTIRARVGEAFVLAGDARTAVAEYYDRWGRLPADNAAAGLGSPEAYRGSIVSAITVKAGVVEVALDMSPYREVSQTQNKLYLRPAINRQHTTGALIWLCGASTLRASQSSFEAAGVVGADSLTPRHLPASCRSSTS